MALRLQILQVLASTRTTTHALDYASRVDWEVAARGEVQEATVDLLCRASVRRYCRFSLSASNDAGD